jgi:trans-aconitate 2-methyltransferase
LDPKPGERILDLGCGTGELTKAIADRAGSLGVIGLDADPNMVAAARSSFPDITFLHADGSSFTLDEPVDAIFSNAALHWVTNAEQAVISMSRALKPGGRMIVEFGGKGNVNRIVQAAQDLLSSSDASNVWYFPSIGEYCSLLEKHGIETTSAALFDRPTVLQGEEGIKNWYRMFGSALLQGTRTEDMERVLSDLEQKLKPHLFDGEKWTADYRRIRIVAHKSTKD